MQEDSVSPARERLGYKPRDDDDVQKKNLSISFCLAFVSLIFIFFFTCPSLLVLPKTLPVQQI